MDYLVYIIVGVIGAVAIYWIMDWKKHHPDGE